LFTQNGRTTLKSQAAFRENDSPYIECMADKLFPMKHKTLRAIRDAGLRLHAFCLKPDCEWHADLDLDAMIEILGGEHSAQQPALVPRLYCSQCGGKSIAVELSASADVPPATVEHIRGRRG
jgi:hypothetical protein